MNIITIPHPTLRKKAELVDPATVKLSELKTFIAQLEQTLATTRNPKGVGLAAPQVDKLWCIFATSLDAPTTYINPEITKHSSALTLGPNPDEPILEGCLSMPQLWGPVPRFEWVELTYHVIGREQSDNTYTLSSLTKRFDQFAARVVQHELDHLRGILFTDHSLKYNLPVYQDSKSNKKSEEVERSFLELI